MCDMYSFLMHPSAAAVAWLKLCLLAGSQLLECCRLLGGPLVALFLRFVLDQLSKATDDKMYAFGVQTLRCFQGQLQQWPQVCQALVNLPNLQQTNPDIFNSASQVLGLALPPGAPSTSTGPGSYNDRAFQPSKDERQDLKGVAGNGAPSGNGDGVSGDGLADGDRELHGDGMQEDEVVPQPQAVPGQGVTPGQEISPPGQVSLVRLNIPHTGCLTRS